MPPRRPKPKDTPAKLASRMKRRFRIVLMRKSGQVPMQPRKWQRSRLVNAMTWVKGQSGNPLGRPHSEKIISDQIRIVVNETDPVSGKRKARLLADKLVDFALEGESWAFAQIMDRLEGKPIQETNVNVTRRLVDELTDDEINRRLADFLGRGRAGVIEGSCEEATDTQEPDLSE